MRAVLIRKLVILSMLLLMGGLAACENTVRGVGRDVEGTGDAVNDTVHGRP